MSNIQVIKPFIESEVDYILEDLEGMFIPAMKVDKFVHPKDYDKNDVIEFEWNIHDMMDASTVYQKVCEGVNNLSKIVPKDQYTFNVLDSLEESQGMRVIVVVCTWQVSPLEMADLPKYGLDNLVRQGYTIASTRIRKYKNGVLTQSGFERDLRQIIQRAIKGYGRLSLCRNVVSFDWNKRFAKFIIKCSGSQGKLYLPQFYNIFIQRAMQKGYQIATTLNEGYQGCSVCQLYDVNTLRCTVQYEVENKRFWLNFQEDIMKG